MKKYDIVTIGSCSQDIFVVPHDYKIDDYLHFTSKKALLFELGEKINLDEVSFQIGGSAGNTAVAFSRLGYKAGVISALGEDYTADKVISTLESEGVDVRLINQNKKRQSNFSVIISTKGERTILIYHGLSDYGEIKIPKVLSANWIYLSPVGHGEEALFGKIIPHLSQNNIQLAWNPGVRQIEKGASHYRSLLALTKIIFLNKEEAIKFVDFPVRPQIADLCRKIHQMGPKMVVITLGRDGAYCFDGENLWYIGVLPAERVDATGAGDSFAAAFMSRFIGQPLSSGGVEMALKYAIVESTSVISKLGAQTGLLTKSEIEKEITKWPKLKVKMADESK